MKRLAENTTEVYGKVETKTDCPVVPRTALLCEAGQTLYALHEYNYTCGTPQSEEIIQPYTVMPCSRFFLSLCCA